jgi:aspartate ammonia-lyase
MMPLMALNMIHSIRLLSNYLPDFAAKCVEGIVANEDHCKHYFERSVGLATALSPFVGYLNAAEIAHEAAKTGESVKALAIRKGIVTEGEFDRITNPLTVTIPENEKRKGVKRK